MCYSINTSTTGSFFWIFLEGGEHIFVKRKYDVKLRRCRHACKNHFGLYGMQATQLQYNEK